jgi:hypothetical protein
MQRQRTSEHLSNLSAHHFEETSFIGGGPQLEKNRRSSVRSVTILLLFFTALVSAPRRVFGGETNRPGLIGVQYGAPDLKKWERAVLLTTLDQSWSKTDGYGHEWSATWSGFVIAPAAGTITFHIETDKGLDLRVDGKTVLKIDAGERQKSGSIIMEKGRLYPIELSLYNTKGFNAYQKVTWSWDRQETTPVPRENLWHSVEQEHACGWRREDPDSTESSGRPAKR